MGRFAMVDCATYGDPAFRALSTDARLLFIWSWTNNQAAICGLYHVSLRQMELALGGTDSNIRVRAALDELGQKPLALYDEDNEVIWVINRVRYANRSPKVARAMQREVEQCPPSPLVEAFVDRHGQALNITLREEAA